MWCGGDATTASRYVFSIAVVDFAGIIPNCDFVLLREFRLFLPEFGERVSDFGGEYDPGWFWWDERTGFGGRVDYLRWLCSCYDIDMDAYFRSLINS